MVLRVGEFVVSGGVGPPRREERSPRRHAHRDGDVPALEEGAARCEPVEVRCGHVVRPVGAKLSPHVIGRDEQHILASLLERWSGWRRRRRRRRGRRRNWRRCWVWTALALKVHQLDGASSTASFSGVALTRYIALAHRHRGGLVRSSVAAKALIAVLDAGEGEGLVVAQLEARGNGQCGPVCPRSRVRQKSAARCIFEATESLSYDAVPRRDGGPMRHHQHCHRHRHRPAAGFLAHPSHLVAQTHTHRTGSWTN
mmetsp:Transcript_31199/g.93604  ORF Transcript_31199/g.93604 Transcript_31199/m.93604 type:complete len:255 (+) Transcript_31199:1481-2245(+)